MRESTATIKLPATNFSISRSCNSWSNHEAPRQIRVGIFSCCLAKRCVGGFGRGNVSRRLSFARHRIRAVVGCRGQRHLEEARPRRRIDFSARRIAHGLGVDRRQRRFYHRLGSRYYDGDSSGRGAYPGRRDHQYLGLFHGQPAGDQERARSQRQSHRHHARARRRLRARRQVAARQRHGFEQRRFVSFGRRRRPGGPSRGLIERRDSRDHVYAAVGHDLRESGHAHPDQDRCGQHRRRLEYLRPRFCKRAGRSFYVFCAVTWKRFNT